MDSVSIVGGTGFVGRYLISALKSGNPSREIRLLSRNPPREKIEGVVWRKADVTRPESLGNTMEGSSSIYYLPGILAETKEQKYEDVHYNGVIAVLRALSKGASPGRFVHVSAIGAGANAPSAYHRTKKKAEEAVAASGIPFTIVRPSLVFGQGDRSINQFLAFGRSLHLLPMIGPGTAKIQPVFAGDLAKVLEKIPDHPEMAGRVIEVGGPRIYTYREMMESLRKSANLKAFIVPAPVAVMMASAILQKLLLPKPFLTPDVIRMALADNVAQRNSPVADFGMNLVSLESWLESEAV